MPEGSKAPTFAACKLTINNERWAGVPFVLRAGKALNERGVLVRMQLHSHPAPLFGVHGDDMRNEFVMRLQPGVLCGVCGGWACVWRGSSGVLFVVCSPCVFGAAASKQRPPPHTNTHPPPTPQTPTPLNKKARRSTQRWS